MRILMLVVALAVVGCCSGCDCGEEETYKGAPKDAKYELTVYSGGQIVSQFDVSKVSRASKSYIRCWDTNGKKHIIVGQWILKEK